MSKQTETTAAELESVALQLFSTRMANMAASTRDKQEALSSFRRAEVFLDVRDQIRNGELDAAPAPAGPQWADCCAPNLADSHPINLVSSRYGNSAAVARINTWLSANPTPE